MVETKVEEGILTSIKESLGLEKDYDAFDPEIIMDINGCFGVLAQLGVGPALGFEITGYDEKWSALLPSAAYYNLVKTYIYINVKLLFDPPETSYAREALLKRSGEYEWRLRLMEESPADE